MITKVLIANRGENSRAAAVSLYCPACAAGDGDLALALPAVQKGT